MRYLLALILTLPIFAQQNRYSLYFDSDSIQVGDLPTLTSWTISAWVKVDNTTQSGNIISTDRSGFDNSILFGINPEVGSSPDQSGKWGVIVQDSTTSARYWVTSTTDATTDWHYIAVTYSTPNLMIFVDTAFEDTTAQANLKISSFSKSWYLGTNSPQHELAFDRSISGILDNVKVYNRALSASELLSDKNSVSTLSGAVAYWDFEEGSGSTITDEINSYSGTLDTNNEFRTNVPFTVNQFVRKKNYNRYNGFY